MSETPEQQRKRLYLKRAIPSPTTPAGENEFVPLEALAKLEAEL